LIVSDHGRRHLEDPGHFRIHAALARLYATRGDAARAISAYRMSIAGKHDGLGVRGRLARLYLGQHHWRAAVLELGRAAAVVPRELRALGRRIRGRLAEAWRNRYRARMSPTSPRPARDVDDGPA
jgi:hypothetical protein